MIVNFERRAYMVSPNIKMVILSSMSEVLLCDMTLEICAMCELTGVAKSHDLTKELYIPSHTSPFALTFRALQW
jgi:hypothetical protein